MAWILLVCAGLAEVGFTTCLKLSENFSKPVPSAGFLALSILSFALLTRAIQTIPLGTAYAVWTGIGAFGTAAIGIVFFKDPLSPARVVFLLVLIGSIIGLKVASTG
ncbi:DMT family transporter [Tautonia sociabilis]|uniref:Guanidinium exporter n=1 Tax=Tautonia sociabilis TaxID=2080755 RepID=A0A432MHM1_9BACT|nr:multidrug efflux SMR transporter [Tautonia sociabilis]RUL86850.1 multidrug efflux SMR transporter [Tautonia sociabilis]